jgi:hypothetical protein
MPTVIRGDFRRYTRANFAQQEARSWSMRTALEAIDC